MPTDNKEVVRRVFEDLWNKHNPSVADEIYASSFINHDPATPDQGRGPEAAKKVAAIYLKAFPDSHFTLNEMFAEGDRVVTRWTVRATHRGELMGTPPTGKEVTTTGITVNRVANGKVVESYVNWDALGLMEQIGAVSRRRQAGA